MPEPYSGILIPNSAIRKGARLRIILPPPHNEFTRALDTKFLDIDADNDGFLSKNEVDVALGDSQYTGNFGAMLATIKKHLGDFEEMSNDELGDENDGITRADIIAYDRLRLKNPNDEVITKMQNMYDYSKNKINAINKNLPQGQLDPLSVEQGLIGDCWFLAAIVGLGLQSEAKLRNMIKKVGNNYEVKFPGISKSIKVESPTDGEIAIFSSAGANGIWLTVLEKAYGASVNRDAYFFVDTSVTDAADHAAFISKGIEIITGSSYDTDIFGARAGRGIEILSLRSKLKTAFENNKVVTAGIRGGIFSDYRENGLPMGHAYTVTGFDGNKNTIRVRNPWGRPSDRQIDRNIITPLARGEFEMSFVNFWKSFSFITFEE